MTQPLPASAPLFPFDNSYRRLPERFYAVQAPSPVAAPVLLAFNAGLAEELGLDAARIEAEGVEIFSGNRLPDGAEPLAAAYAGHQFGGFVPQLGDGRAVLLGEVIDRQGHRRDIQLKGAGPTPFSRRGDGRAALGPVLREYIVSEAMHALGIPTTRALAAVATGEPVYRETVQPGAIVTRVAASHIRVGTFQYFAARGDEEALRLLADHAIMRHYPELAGAENRYLAFFQAVTARQAALVARWLQVGFIHGVMNTDNMAISGETIDFGPCAFLDAYEANKVFSSIDSQGRYAYANQPAIAQWNLARLAETLLPLFDVDGERAVGMANEALSHFGDTFQRAWLSGMKAKIGLTASEEEDLGLIQTLLAVMQSGHADFTLAFRALSDLAAGDTETAFLSCFLAERDAASDWLARWRERLSREPRSAAEAGQAMRAVNPCFIPRNHRIEQAIRAAVEDGDLSLFQALNRVLARPYEDQPGFAAFKLPPEPDERVIRTFCGT